MDKTDTSEKASGGAKTPMWKISQLARHHQIKPIYKLEKEESGKIRKFTMSLTLDNTTWTGCANTKKQAQQNAAKNALQNTTLSSPPSAKKETCQNPKSLTATVRLNGWAMAHGKQVVYTVTSKKFQPNYHFNSQQRRLLANAPVFVNEYTDPLHGVDAKLNFSHLGYPPPFSFPITNGYRQRHREVSCQFTVCAQVGPDKFFGSGTTQQAARHDAASNALAQVDKTEEKPKSDAGDKSSGKVKSSISRLHEETIPRNMTVVFNTLAAKGPAHLRHYTIEVSVAFPASERSSKEQAEFRAIGTGMSKKMAKKDAADQVLEELLKALPPRTVKSYKSQKLAIKPRPPPSTTLHPVSRLMQICQAQKIQEPSYTIIKEGTEKSGGVTAFLVGCSLLDKSVTGAGRSKKEAKKAAADAMLVELGKQPIALQPIPNKDMVPQKSSIKLLVRDKSQTSRQLQVKFSQIKTDLQV